MGVDDYGYWQTRWRTLAVIPARYYDVLSGRVRWRFVYALAAEFVGVWERRWIVDRFIVFQMVILQHARHVKTFGNIW